MNKIYMIIKGNNKATYIFNLKDMSSLTLSLKFYKAFTFRQKFVKILLFIFLFLTKIFKKNELKNINEIKDFIKEKTLTNLDIKITDNFSILISPTQDKIIVHCHNENSFYKYAFNKSLENVKNEVVIYNLFNNKTKNFKISKISNFIQNNEYCSFKLNNIENKKYPKNFDLVKICEEFFKINTQNVDLNVYIYENFKNINKELNEKLEKILALYKQKNILLGLVHKDFKPWNMEKTNPILIYDFEETKQGLLLEDLLNYYIDPMISTKKEKEILNYLQNKSLNKQIDIYLEKFNALELKRFLICFYLFERTYFWGNKNKINISEKYLKILTKYLENDSIAFVHLLNDYSGSPKILTQVLKKYSSSDIELYSSNDIGFLSKIVKNHHNFFYKRFNNKFLTLFSYFISQLQLMIKILFSNKDIVYINTLLPFGAAIAAKIKSKKVIYHIHETSIKPLILKKFLRFIVRITASKIIFVSKNLEKEEKFENVNSRIIHNSIEKDFFNLALKNRYKHLHNNSFVVMMICSLKDYKGIPEFIKISKILKENHNIKFRLILNAQKKEINDYFNHEDLQNIEIFSKQENLHKFYSTSSLVLNLSRIDEWIETFGLTLIEAMAYAIPVIAPNIGGPTEIVDDNINGYLISSYETQAIAEKILELSMNENICYQLSNNALYKAKSFNEDIFLENIQGFINE